VTTIRSIGESLVTDIHDAANEALEAANSENKRKAKLEARKTYKEISEFVAEILDAHETALFEKGMRQELLDKMLVDFHQALLSIYMSPPSPLMMMAETMEND
jgi:hypothetical protein